jgi:prepilin-type N-terminal cleavage/methylation domain-containing protein
MHPLPIVTLSPSSMWMKGTTRVGHKARAGFTLIEILIVIAIIGVLLAVGIPNIIRENRVTAVRQVATQLQADLEELRSKSIRFNRNATFTFGTNSYTRQVPSSEAGGFTSAVRTIPAGLSVTYVTTSTPSADTFVYEAPIAQVSPAVRGFQVTFNSDPSVQLFVKVIGVTGKAVISATN